MNVQGRREINLPAKRQVFLQLIFKRGQMQKKQAHGQKGGAENTDPDTGGRNAGPGRKRSFQSLPGRIIKDVTGISFAAIRYA
jgi:hypothetical protein